MGSARKVEKVAYLLAATVAIIGIGAVGTAAIVVRSLWAVLDRREQ